ncbi:hypothetical protein [Bartonella sp. AA86SXKL]|uniref:hypothetical protein n=1 Tax=Bartonella sp. AA86SXKL TaxID=3243441 RepID=UPI0035D0F944
MSQTLGAGKVCDGLALLLSVKVSAYSFVSVKMMGLYGFSVIAFMNTIAKWAVLPYKNGLWYP